MIWNRSLAATALLALVLSTGCGRDEPEAPAAAPAQGEPAVVEGLSREEISRRAEPMSPEQAEQLGIVDTTIHVERLINPEDTLLLPDTVPPSGTRPR